MTTQSVREKHSHYHKAVPPGVTHIDVYWVLKLFEVNDPSLQHAIKKLLVAGGRGAGKSFTKDVGEAIDSLQRAIEMHEVLNLPQVKVEDIDDTLRDLEAQSADTLTLDQFVDNTVQAIAGNLGVSKTDLLAATEPQKIDTSNPARSYEAFASDTTAAHKRAGFVQNAVMQSLARAVDDSRARRFAVEAEALNHEIEAINRWRNGGLISDTAAAEAKVSVMSQSGARKKFSMYPPGSNGREEA